MICVFNKRDPITLSAEIQTEYFQLGNVDLLHRPQVPGQTLIDAGWTDAGTGTATVYSNSYSAGSDGIEWDGPDIIIHITPIKTDGTVLGPDALDTYVENLLGGSTIQSVLSADSTGLILWVQEVTSGWEAGYEYGDLYDDLLHRLQAVYYLHDLEEFPPISELKAFNSDISLYSDFTGNGDAVLVPTEAKLKMVAGGNYDLTMSHPMDPDGKWRHLVPGAIVKVPVPEEEIANAFAGMDADVYKVTTATDLREGPTEPETINYPAWSETTAAQGGYEEGSKVTFGPKNYQCTYMDTGSIVCRVIPSQSAWWKEIPRTMPGAPVLVSLPVGSEVYFVEDVDTSWYKMSTYYGIVGYVKKDKVTYDRHLTPSETKPRFITDQLLRITNAAADTKNKTVSVTAQHVSYDLNGVIIKDISISQASPGMALARIVDGFMIPYPGTIATNLDSETHGTYTGDIKGKSGMYALLDPDKGIVGTFDAAFRRDNWDLFVMEKTDTDRGFQLRRQKNLLGVNWTRKSDSLINRVVPVAKDEGGADLYLPEVWIDSPNIISYPVIRMEMLSMKEQVGKDKGTGDGSTWTEADLMDEMRKRAAERFSVDKVDQVITEVTVDFEMLGATAEHPELKALESVLLYDKVRVIDETIGLDTQLTSIELEYDALKKKVTSLKISNAEDQKGKNVTGYNVQPKSIGNDKLADEVAGDIMQQVKDIIPEYTDPDAARPSSNIDVIDNLTSTSATDALSANQGKVLNGHFGNFGTNSNPVGLDDLPLSGVGYAILNATDAPSGVKRAHLFVKAGNSNSNYSVIAVEFYSAKAYFIVKYNGTMGTWKQLSTV